MRDVTAIRNVQPEAWVGDETLTSYDRASRMGDGRKIERDSFFTPVMLFRILDMKKGRLSSIRGRNGIFSKIHLFIISQK